MQVKNCNLYIAYTLCYKWQFAILKDIYILVSLSDNVSITIFFAYA